MINLKVVNKSKNEIPSYATINSAGMDLRASLEQGIVIRPGERKLIPTGLFLEIPVGYEGQVRPRSGFALKSGVTVLNSPGTIDADYRGEVGVILINLSNVEVEIVNGDRIAQLIIAKYETVKWVEVDSLKETDRGSGGFGHTGKS
jgi:dUTP pyrophosphatase